jgi:hypothetical protein
MDRECLAIENISYFRFVGDNFTFKPKEKQLQKTKS